MGQHPDIFGDDRIPHGKLSDQRRVLRAGIMTPGVIAVGIGKLGIHHPQPVSLPVHFRHENLHRLHRIQLGIPGDLPPRSRRHDIGRVIAAGQQHPLDEHLHRQAVSLAYVGHRGSRLHQGKLLPGGDHRIRLQIHQRHKGTVKLGDAGRIQLVIQLRAGVDHPLRG